MGIMEDLERNSNKSGFNVINNYAAEDKYLNSYLQGKTITKSFNNITYDKEGFNTAFFENEKYRPNTINNAVYLGPLSTKNGVKSATDTGEGFALYYDKNLRMQFEVNTRNNTIYKIFPSGNVFNTELPKQAEIIMTTQPGVSNTQKVIKEIEKNNRTVIGVIGHGYLGRGYSAYKTEDGYVENIIDPKLLTGEHKHNKGLVLSKDNKYSIIKGLTTEKLHKLKQEKVKSISIFGVEAEETGKANRSFLVLTKENKLNYLYLPQEIPLSKSTEYIKKLIPNFVDYVQFDKDTFAGHSIIDPNTQKELENSRGKVPYMWNQPIFVTIPNIKNNEKDINKKDINKKDINKNLNNEIFDKNFISDSVNLRLEEYKEDLNNPEKLKQKGITGTELKLVNTLYTISPDLAASAAYFKKDLTNKFDFNILGILVDKSIKGVITSTTSNISNYTNNTIDYYVSNTKDLNYKTNNLITNTTSDISNYTNNTIKNSLNVLSYFFIETPKKLINQDIEFQNELKKSNLKIQEDVLKKIRRAQNKSRDDIKKENNNFEDDKNYIRDSFNVLSYFLVEMPRNLLAQDLEFQNERRKSILVTQDNIIENIKEVHNKHKGKAPKTNNQSNNFISNIQEFWPQVLKNTFTKTKIPSYKLPKEERKIPSSQTTNIPNTIPKQAETNISQNNDINFNQPEQKTQIVPKTTNKPKAKIPSVSNIIPSPNIVPKQAETKIPVNSIDFNNTVDDLQETPKVTNVVPKQTPVNKIPEVNNVVPKKESNTKTPNNNNNNSTPKKYNEVPSANKPKQKTTSLNSLQKVDKSKITVVDGDSFFYKGNVIRLADADTPETSIFSKEEYVKGKKLTPSERNSLEKKKRQKGRQEGEPLVEKDLIDQPYGIQATEESIKFIKDSKNIFFINTNQEANGRLVLDLVNDEGEKLSQHLIKEGLAITFLPGQEFYTYTVKAKNNADLMIKAYQNKKGQFSVNEIDKLRTPSNFRKGSNTPDLAREINLYVKRREFQNKGLLNNEYAQLLANEDAYMTLPSRLGASSYYGRSLFNNLMKQGGYDNLVLHKKAGVAESVLTYNAMMLYGQDPTDSELKTARAYDNALYTPGLGAVLNENIFMPMGWGRVYKDELGALPSLAGLLGRVLDEGYLYYANINADYEILGYDFQKGIGYKDAENPTGMFESIFANTTSFAVAMIQATAMYIAIVQPMEMIRSEMIKSLMDSNLRNIMITQSNFAEAHYNRQINNVDSLLTSNNVTGGNALQRQFNNITSIISGVATQIGLMVDNTSATFYFGGLNSTNNLTATVIEQSLILNNRYADTYSHHYFYNHNEAPFSLLGAQFAIERGRSELLLRNLFEPFFMDLNPYDLTTIEGQTQYSKFNKYVDDLFTEIGRPIGLNIKVKKGRSINLQQYNLETINNALNDVDSELRKITDGNNTELRQELHDLFKTDKATLASNSSYETIDTIKYKGEVKTISSFDTLFEPYIKHIKEIDKRIYEAKLKLEIPGLDLNSDEAIKYVAELKTYSFLKEAYEIQLSSQIDDFSFELTNVGSKRKVTIAKALQEVIDMIPMNPLRWGFFGGKGIVDPEEVLMVGQILSFRDAAVFVDNLLTSNTPYTRLFQAYKPIVPNTTSSEGRLTFFTALSNNINANIISLDRIGEEIFGYVTDKTLTKYTERNLAFIREKVVDRFNNKLEAQERALERNAIKNQEKKIKELNAKRKQERIIENRKRRAEGKKPLKSSTKVRVSDGQNGMPSTGFILTDFRSNKDIAYQTGEILVSELANEQDVNNLIRTSREMDIQLRGYTIVENVLIDSVDEEGAKIYNEDNSIKKKTVSKLEGEYRLDPTTTGRNKGADVSESSDFLKVKEGVIDPNTGAHRVKKVGSNIEDGVEVILDANGKEIKLLEDILKQDLKDYSNALSESSIKNVTGAILGSFKKHAINLRAERILTQFKGIGAGITFASLAFNMVSQSTNGPSIFNQTMFALVAEDKDIAIQFTGNRILPVENLHDWAQENFNSSPIVTNTILDIAFIGGILGTSALLARTFKTVGYSTTTYTIEQLQKELDNINSKDTTKKLYKYGKYVNGVLTAMADDISLAAFVGDLNNDTIYFIEEVSENVYKQYTSYRRTANGFESVKQLRKTVRDVNTKTLVFGAMFIIGNNALRESLAYGLKEMGESYQSNNGYQLALGITAATTILGATFSPTLHIGNKIPTKFSGAGLGFFTGLITSFTVMSYKGFLKEKTPFRDHEAKGSIDPLLYSTAGALIGLGTGIARGKKFALGSMLVGTFAGAVAGATMNWFGFRLTTLGKSSKELSEEELMLVSRLSMVSSIALEKESEYSLSIAQLATAAMVGNMAKKYSLEAKKPYGQEVRVIARQAPLTVLQFFVAEKIEGINSNTGGAVNLTFDNERTKRYYTLGIQTGASLGSGLNLELPIMYTPKRGFLGVSYNPDHNMTSISDFAYTTGVWAGVALGTLSTVLTISGMVAQKMGNSYKSSDLFTLRDGVFSGMKMSVNAAEKIVYFLAKNAMRVALHISTIDAQIAMNLYAQNDEQVKKLLTEYNSIATQEGVDSIKKAQASAEFLSNLDPVIKSRLGVLQNSKTSNLNNINKFVLGHGKSGALHIALGMLVYDLGAQAATHFKIQSMYLANESFENIKKAEIEAQENRGWKVAFFGGAGGAALYGSKVVLASLVVKQANSDAALTASATMSRQITFAERIGQGTTKALNKIGLRQPVVRKVSSLIESSLGLNKYLSKVSLNGPSRLALLFTAVTAINYVKTSTEFGYASFMDRHIVYDEQGNSTIDYDTQSMHNIMHHMLVAGSLGAITTGITAFSLGVSPKNQMELLLSAADNTHSFAIKENVNQLTKINNKLFFYQRHNTNKQIGEVLKALEQLENKTITYELAASKSENAIRGLPANVRKLEEVIKLRQHLGQEELLEFIKLHNKLTFGHSLLEEEQTVYNQFTSKMNSYLEGLDETETSKLLKGLGRHNRLGDFAIKAAIVGTALFTIHKTAAYIGGLGGEPGYNSYLDRLYIYGNAKGKMGQIRQDQTKVSFFEGMPAVAADVMRMMTGRDIVDITSVLKRDAGGSDWITFTGQRMPGNIKNLRQAQRTLRNLSEMFIINNPNSYIPTLEYGGVTLRSRDGGIETSQYFQIQSTGQDISTAAYSMGAKFMFNEYLAGNGMLSNIIRSMTDGLHKDISEKEFKKMVHNLQNATDMLYSLKNPRRYSTAGQDIALKFSGDSIASLIIASRQEALTHIAYQPIERLAVSLFMEGINSANIKKPNQRVGMVNLIKGLIKRDELAFEALAFALSNKGGQFEKFLKATSIVNARHYVGSHQVYKKSGFSNELADPNNIWQPNESLSVNVDSFIQERDNILFKFWNDVAIPLANTGVLAHAHPWIRNLVSAGTTVFVTVGLLVAFHNFLKGNETIETINDSLKVFGGDRLGGGHLGIAGNNIDFDNLTKLLNTSDYTAGIKSVAFSNPSIYDVTGVTDDFFTLVGIDETLPKPAGGEAPKPNRRYIALVDVSKGSSEIRYARVSLNDMFGNLVTTAEGEKAGPTATTVDAGAPGQSGIERIARALKVDIGEANRSMFIIQSKVALDPRELVESDNKPIKRGEAGNRTKVSIVNVFTDMNYLPSMLDEVYFNYYLQNIEGESEIINALMPEKATATYKSVMDNLKQKAKEGQLDDEILDNLFTRYNQWKEGSLKKSNFLATSIYKNNGLTKEVNESIQKAYIEVATDKFRQVFKQRINVDKNSGLFQLVETELIIKDTKTRVMVPVVDFLDPTFDPNTIELKETKPGSNVFEYANFDDYINAKIKMIDDAGTAAVLEIQNIIEKEYTDFVNSKTKRNMPVNLTDSEVITELNAKIINKIKTEISRPNSVLHSVVHNGGILAPETINQEAKVINNANNIGVRTTQKKNAEGILELTNDVLEDSLHYLPSKSGVTWWGLTKSGFGLAMTTAGLLFDLASIIETTAASSRVVEAYTSEFATSIEIDLAEKEYGNILTSEILGLAVFSQLFRAVGLGWRLATVNPIVTLSVITAAIVAGITSIVFPKQTAKAYDNVINNEALQSVNKRVLKPTGNFLNTTSDAVGSIMNKPTKITAEVTNGNETAIAFANIGTNAVVTFGKMWLLWQGLASLNTLIKGGSIVKAGIGLRAGGTLFGFSFLPVALTVVFLVSAYLLADHFLDGKLSRGLNKGISDLSKNAFGSWVFSTPYERIRMQRRYLTYVSNSPFSFGPHYKVLNQNWMGWLASAEDYTGGEQASILYGPILDEQEYSVSAWRIAASESSIGSPDPILDEVIYNELKIRASLAMDTIAGRHTWNQLLKFADNTEVIKQQEAEQRRNQMQILEEYKVKLMKNVSTGIANVELNAQGIRLRQLTAKQIARIDSVHNQLKELGKESIQVKEVQVVTHQSEVKNNDNDYTEEVKQQTLANGGANTSPLNILNKFSFKAFIDKTLLAINLNKETDELNASLIKEFITRDTNLNDINSFYQNTAQNMYYQVS